MNKMSLKNLSESLKKKAYRLQSFKKQEEWKQYRNSA
jgi:hypothetical protein